MSKTNVVPTETPKVTGTCSTDPKTEPGKIVEGETTSVDETLLDIRCSRDSEMNEYPDKDTHCCDPGDSTLAHAEASDCSNKTQVNWNKINQKKIKNKKIKVRNPDTHKAIAHAMHKDLAPDL